MFDIVDIIIAFAAGALIVSVLSVHRVAHTLLSRYWLARAQQINRLISLVLMIALIGLIAYRIATGQRG